MKLYRREGRVAERPHLNLPEGTFEEEIGLEGFFGPVSHLYHKKAPTEWSGISRSNFQWPSVLEAKPDFLRPQSYKNAPAAGGDFFESNRTLFWNDDVAIHSVTPNKDQTAYFRNADASELFFVHSGEATLESPFGSLKATVGDYIVVPKGCSFRWKTKGAEFLRVESFQSWFKKPETGILGQQALYHEEGIRSPIFDPAQAKEGKSLVRIQKEKGLTEVQYDFDIRALSGWCGTLYPYALSIQNIAPILSSIAHLPPSINATFQCPQFIVCTFLPRPLEEPAGALRVPFFHSNIDYDEFIFYHAGNFFSRDNMNAGYMTMHPRGIDHGPHPKALATQKSKTRTDEVAVMIDTVKPLKISEFGASLENKDYWKSWRSA